MPKILKNSTTLDIILDELAVTIPALGQYTVPHQKYLLLSTDDVINELSTLITSGDVIVNDGINDFSTTNEGINFLKYPDSASNITFTPTADIAHNTVQEAIAAGVSTAINTPRYTIPLIYNGTVGNNEFIGYSNLIPGDATPIVIPVKSVLQEYTFSNSKYADFTIELRKNSTTATVFNTATNTNTTQYVQSEINQTFNAGETIFIKYLDNGVNASDLGLILIFQSIP